MDYRNLGNLLIRVAGATIIAYVFVTSPVYLSFYYSSNADSFIAFLGLALLPILLPLLVGLVLFVLPGTVTNRIIHANDGKSIEFDVREIEQLAFSVLGLYLLFIVLSDTVHHIASFYLLPSATDDSSYQKAVLLPTFIATLAELCFALYLLLGGRGLALLLARLRGRVPRSQA